MVYICSYMKRFERILLAIALSGIILSAGDICVAKDSAVSSSESLSSNATATRMIKTVGRKMVSALEAYIKEHGKDDAMSGLKWEFMLLDSDEVNAFCSPDGKIAFLEGILKYADTPDYIAVVMGHEMAHALAKHGRNRQTVATLVNLIGVVASEVVGAKKGDLAQLLFDLGFGVGSQLGVMLPYSRKQEYEADKIGLYIMQIAGYDINAAPVFWERMMKGSESMQLDFISTHPSDQKRIAALKEVIEDMPVL